MRKAALPIVIGMASLGFVVPVSRDARAADLLPYQSSGWRYMQVGSGDPLGTTFMAPSFDDSGWPVGTAAFGNQAMSCPLNPTVHTHWARNTEMLLRHTFSADPGSPVTVHLAIDNDAMVWVNGMFATSVASESCATADAFSVVVPATALTAGSNLLAVRAIDRGAVCFVDARLEGQPPAPTGCVVGDTTQPPMIEITAVPDTACGGGFLGEIVGRANNVDTSRTVVVLYAETDAYYCQPFGDARRFTRINCGDGTFRNNTRGGCRYWAVLADTSWDAPCQLGLLPPLRERFCQVPNDSILGIACLPCPRSVSFGLEKPEPKNPLGEIVEWAVKGPCCPLCVGPDSNLFSASENNVWVDGEGLHLKLGQAGPTWTSAEIMADTSRGYDSYTFRLGSRVDSLPRSVVFSGFTYESDVREIDIEFAGDALIPGSDNAQFVVQPHFHSGNIYRFRMPPVAQSSHRFTWRPDSIRFVSWEGWTNEPQPGNTIAAWTYGGPDIPPPGCERFHFNLWLRDENQMLDGICKGDPPENAEEVEVLVGRHSVGLAVNDQPSARSTTLVWLEPNVPNPFSSETTIHFVADVGGQVGVDVLDLTGRRVRALLHEHRSAGRHAVTWDGMGETGHGVPAGVYWYRVTLDGHAAARRLLVLR